MWRKAIVIPILKAKITASELSSLRPIFLISILAKTVKCGQCRIKLLVGKPKSLITNAGMLQELLLNKSTNCCA
jgi:hypothetical protein